MKSSTLLLTSLVLITGCASKLKVASEPAEAEIVVSRSSQPEAEKKSIGKTPLELPMEDFVTQMGGGFNPGEFLTFEIRKSGFVTESFKVPVQRFGTLITDLNAKLVADEAEKNKAQEIKTAQDLVNRLFLAQRFAVSQQFERALIELDKILEKHPQFARALSMKGAVYFAQKNYAESLKWYEEALKIDPQMDETIKMTARVREVMSGRAPANTRGPQSR